MDSVLVVMHGPMSLHWLVGNLVLCMHWGFKCVCMRCNWLHTLQEAAGHVQSRMFWHNDGINCSKHCLHCGSKGNGRPLSVLVQIWISCAPQHDALCVAAVAVGMYGFSTVWWLGHGACEVA